MLSIIRADKEPIDPGTYNQLPIIYIGKDTTLLSTRIRKMETVYQVKVPEGERYKLIGVGERKGQGLDVQYLETVGGPPSILNPGTYEPLFVVIRCGRQSGGGVKIKSGETIAYLISDQPTFQVNTKAKAKKAA